MTDKIIYCEHQTSKTILLCGHPAVVFFRNGNYYFAYCKLHIPNITKAAKIVMKSEYITAKLLDS